MSEEIRQLPLSAVRECPTNPRTVYLPSKLAELADSIRANGVMQPIIVRSLFADRPEGPPADAVERYEVIFGHRRLRASKLAKCDSIPAIVRELDAEQVAIAQLVENAQREDVTALDEAESFRRLIDDHKVKVPEIIKQTGKSKSYVYARLKLLHLDPKVKAAMADGTIEAEVGVLIARLPFAAQADALDEVTISEDGKLEGMSYRESKRVLKRYLVDLDEESPFPLDADDLSTTAPACTKCQRRSGNNPDLQPELGDNVCTSRTCFGAKSAIFTQRRINAAKEAGQQVIEGDAARRVQYYPGSYMSGYRKMDDDARLPNGAIIKVYELIEQCGAQAPAAALLSHPAEPTKLIQVISTEAIERMCKIAAGIDPDAPSQRELLPSDVRESGADEDSSPREMVLDVLPEEQRHILDEEHWQKVQQAILAKIPQVPRDGEDLRLILTRELDMGDDFGELIEGQLGWDRAALEDLDYHDARWARIEKLQALTHDRLAEILVMLAVLGINRTFSYTPIEHRAHAEKEAELRLTLASRYGIDPRTGEPADGRVQTPAKPRNAKANRAEEILPDRDPNTGDLFDTPSTAARALKGAKAGKAKAGAGGKASRANGGKGKPGSAGQEQTDDGGCAAEHATEEAAS